MTYDGYGRLQSQHIPAQDANTATSYEYDDDDMTKKVTDARGASQTFTYKNRHLLESVTYSAPAGVTPTSPVTFDYDAVGNRTSMVDGLGSVIYHYNTQSSMDWEARTFSDPNNASITGVTRTVSYEYNLAGQLTKVTDPFGSVVNYGIDATGRLTNVAGSGYGSVTQFISNMLYRAWGALKSESYGHGFSASANYNARLKIQDFAVRSGNSTSVMVDSYQYYSDGRLKFSDDNEQELDRGYAYDHVGRVTEAYSGSEARDFLNGTQSGTATGIYRQSYQYSAMGHVAQETNRLWSETKTTTSTFVNDRRQGWNYDAEGNLTHNDSTSFAYDAAGRLVLSIGPPFNSSARYDGDGRMIYSHYTSPYTTPFTKNVYYLPSTPLGGLAVAELNISGEKTKGNVYAGGRKIAEAVDSTVKWHHQDPLIGSMGESDNNGAYTAIAEFNADGVNVGFEDPAYAEPAVSPKLKTEIPMLAQRGGCTGTPCAQICYVNGFELDCGMVSSLTEAGAAAQCPDNQCGPSWKPNRDGPGRSGYEEPILGPYGFSFKPLGPSTNPLVKGDQPVGGAEGKVYVPWPTPFNKDLIKELVIEALGKEPCADFSKRILDAVSSKKNPALGGGNLATIFGLFLSNGGDYTRTAPKGSAGYGNPIGRIMGKRGARIYTSHATGWQASFDADGTIGELFHLAGSKEYYGDKLLADAAHAIPEYAALMDAALKPKVNIYSGRYEKIPDETPEYGHSIYFHHLQKLKCAARLAE